HSPATAPKLRSVAITTNKLTNAAVTTPELADDAVNSAKLADGSVSLNKFGKSVIGTIQTRGLESAQTLRAVFDVGWTAAAADETTRDAVSFQFPLANAPTVTVLSKAGEPTAGCGGRGGGGTQTPQAAPGNLCVYVAESTNLDIPALAVENN